MFASPRSELLALLSAIKTDPEENTPKLALADWLQEQPDESDRARSEFLYRFVQNNLLAKSDPARQDFAALTRLWNTHETAWAGTLRRAGFVVWATNYMFRWGLLFPTLEGSAAALARAEAVANLEEYAWVAGIAFRAIDPHIAGRFADSPLLDSLIALRIGYAEDCHSLVERLVDSPRVAHLRELDLSHTPLSDDTADVLVRSPYLSNLHRLDLTTNWFGAITEQRLRDRFGAALLLN